MGALTQTIPALPGLELIERVGEGGMATVWKARDVKNDRIVAVKILRADDKDLEENLAAFKDEEHLMSEIRHPGIVEAYEINHVGNIWYFVMEFVDGYTFADYLRRKYRLPESDCLLICESVAVALNEVWNEHGIVHCDIKPENIMINTAGEIKLTDLGISHRFDISKLSSREVSEHVLGTPAYISPEQVYGDVELDCRADIYALAATLYHLSTGRILFPALSNEETMRAHCHKDMQANDPRIYCATLSEGFCQMLEAMLVKDREDRIGSWDIVFQMCRDIESGHSFKPRESTSPSSLKLLA